MKTDFSPSGRWSGIWSRASGFHWNSGPRAGPSARVSGAWNHGCQWMLNSSITAKYRVRGEWEAKKQDKTLCCAGSSQRNQPKWAALPSALNRCLLNHFTENSFHSRRVRASARFYRDAALFARSAVHHWTKSLNGAHWHSGRRGTATMGRGTQAPVARGCTLFALLWERFESCFSACCSHVEFSPGNEGALRKARPNIYHMHRASDPQGQFIQICFVQSALI